MFKFILIAFLLISLFQWFSNNMAVKGLLYYIGTEFGEDELDKIDMKKIIQTAIEKTLDDLKL